MNPEVFLNASQKVTVALLRDYDLAAREAPYAVSIAPLGITVTPSSQVPLDVWDLVDGVVMGWCRGLGNDEWQSLTLKLFFEGGYALVPCHVTRQNANGFSSLAAFYELVTDGSSAGRD